MSKFGWPYVARLIISHWPFFPNNRSFVNACAVWLVRPPFSLCTQAVCTVDERQTNAMKLKYQLWNIFIISFIIVMNYASAVPGSNVQPQVIVEGLHILAFATHKLDVYRPNTASRYFLGSLFSVFLCFLWLVKCAHGKNNNFSANRDVFRLSLKNAF